MLCKCGNSDLEAMVRRVLREELAAAQNQSPRLTSNQCGGISEARYFQLRFVNNLKREYYTQKNILAEGDEPIQIDLLDVRSQSIVNEGPMSSMKIDMCVLPGDFGSNEDDHQNWSREKFVDSILRPREGKKALLKGDTGITLKDGVGSIRNEIEFTDNSSWLRSGTFRLAAKSKEANVMEATSQPFTVKDKRAIMKLERPSLNSEVWRLKHIGKGGRTHKQMSVEGIETVKILLQRYTINPSLLREKFSNIPSGKWQDIIKNARACVIDDKERYLYCAAEGPLCFVFNSIYEVVMVSFDNGQTYRSPETFTSDEKLLVEIAKQEAYENEGDFKPWSALENNLQAAQFSAGGPPAEQGQEFDWWATSSFEQLYLEGDFGCCSSQPLFNPDAAASSSTPSERKSKMMWIKIGVAFKFLTSLCR